MISATLFEIGMSKKDTVVPNLVQQANKQRKLVLSLFDGRKSDTLFPASEKDLARGAVAVASPLSAALKQEVVLAARWMNTDPPAPVTLQWLHRGFRRETQDGTDKQLVARFSETWDAAQFQENMVRTRKGLETFLAIAHEGDRYLASVVVWFTRTGGCPTKIIKTSGNMVGIFSRLAVQMASGGPGRPRMLADVMLQAILAEAEKRAAFQFCVFSPRANMKAILTRHGFRDAHNGFVVKLLIKEETVMPELCDTSVVDEDEMSGKRKRKKRKSK